MNEILKCAESTILKPDAQQQTDFQIEDGRCALVSDDGRDVFIEVVSELDALLVHSPLQLNTADDGDALFRQYLELNALVPGTGLRTDQYDPAGSRPR